MLKFAFNIDLFNLFNLIKIFLKTWQTGNEILKSWKFEKLKVMLKISLLQILTAVVEVN